MLKQSLQSSSDQQTTTMELSNGGTSLTSQPNQNPSNGDSGQDTLDSQETEYYDGIDSNCSTPYVSAPSSPGRGPISGFFYSAPASPMHFAVSPKCSNSNNCSSSFDSHTSEFEFSARFGSSGSGLAGPMSSADELFLNGKIRPMKLSTHLEKPQSLAPLLDLEEEEEADDLFEFGPMRGRDLRMRDKSMRRRTRSLSPLRNMPFEDCEIYCAQEKDFNFGDVKVKNESKSKSSEMGEEEEDEEVGSLETTPSVSASSSRSSSAGRNSKRWVFLKDFLHRSKSEGRSNNKFWNTISFSNMKDKKPIKAGGPKEQPQPLSLGSEASPKVKPAAPGKKPAVAGKPANGVGKRRMAPSLHELHYTANRAQAEEMRKKTYLPYRQGLLGCLGFSSKGYGAAMNTGFARALNPVSSR